MHRRCVSFGSIAAVALIGFALESRADIVFNNFGPGNSFSDSGRLLQGESVGSIANVDQAVSFKVGSSSYGLTRVAIGIFADTPPNTGTGPLDILIASDAGGLPGAILRTYAFDVNTTGKQVLSATDDGSLILSPNTQYWVIADARGTYDGSWNFNSTGDTGDTAGRSNNGAWSLRPGDDRMALSVEGALVPEPSSAALLGAGGMLLLARRRR